MAECLTDQNFLACVRQSNLCEPPALDSYLNKLRNLNALPQDSLGLARRLVVDGLLTKYQAEQLLMGRWKNFVIKGKYKVLERLSTGSMSNVFICEHILMKRVVALKMLPEDQSEDTAAVARFHREARASAKLRHQNVVTVYDVDSAGKHHFLVAEYIDGSDLERVVKVSGPMPFLRASNYVRQAAEGLQHAHEMGMVHRDIKPGNLLLDRRGTVKLLDLGLARLFQDETDGLTKMADGHLMLGTLDYLAPEQAIDSHSVDIRADIYGLGATFYFLLAGEALFAGSSKAQKFIQHKNFSVGPIIRGVPGLPEKLALIVEKMLAKNPADRFQSPAEVAHALEPWTTVPVTIPSIQEMPKLSPRTRRSLEEMGSGSDVSNLSATLISRSSMTPLPSRIRGTLDRARVLKRTVSSHKYLVGGGVAALIALFLVIRSFTGSPVSASAKHDVVAAVPPVEPPAASTAPPVSAVKTIDEAFALAKAGRTSEAAPALRRLLMANPNSADLQWMQLVVLDLKNADSKAYRSDVAEAFKRFGQGENLGAGTAEKLAKISLLAPEPIELNRALALADSAVVGASELKWGQWFLLARGMALYRAGRYDEAISQLVETRDKASTENDESCECQSQLFLAMAHARLKHESQARAELDRGIALMHPDDMAAFHGHWYDWIASQVIYREAETVLISPSLAIAKAVMPAPAPPPTLTIEAAFDLVKVGRAAEATPSIRRALMANANSPDIHWVQLATLDLKIGDYSSYRSDAMEMLKRFGSGSNLEHAIAERVAKVCLLGPEPVEVARATALAEAAMVTGGTGKWSEWVLLARAMATYRSGRYDEAISQLVEARDRSSTEMDTSCECQCQFFLAMAHARAKHDAEARTELLKGVRLLATDDVIAADGRWHDWVGAQVLRTEAEAVLKGQSLILVKASPPTAPVVTTVEEAFTLAKAGRTVEAAPPLRRLLMADPTASDQSWLQLVTLDLKNADDASYRSDVAEMFKKFGNVDKPWPGLNEKLAKVSLLGPEPIDVNRALALAESAASEAGDVEWGEWFLLVRGMALYRVGRYDDAIKQLVETRDKSSSKKSQVCECLSLLFMSMAHVRLKNEPLAREEFAKADLLMYKGDLTAYDGSWHDWMAAQLVQREAEAVLKGRTTTLVKASPSTAPVVLTLEQALDLAKAGRTVEAAPAIRRVLAANPNSEDLQWMQLAIIDLKNGDNAAYRSDVEEMIKRYGAINNRWVAERVAKACLLGPEPIELTRAAALAESAAAEGSKEKYGEWFMLTRGIALYRTERFDDAIKQLVEAREKSTTENNGVCECTSQLFMAMAHARLKHDAQARMEFDRGARLIPPDNQTEHAGSWFDWFGARVIRSEAEAVLKGPTAAAAKPSPAPTSTKEQVDAAFSEAYSLAIANHPQEAAASYRKALVATPESDYQWLRLAILDAKNADAEAYLRDSTDILARFGETTDAATAERVAKSVLIAPSTIDLKRVQRLAELAGSRGKAMEEGGWFLLVHGMWLYRAGQYEDAVRELIAARDKTPEDAPRCRSLVHFFLAMSYGRLNRPGPSNEEFKIGLDLLKAHGPQDGQNDLDGDWHDWFAVQVARREAEALLKAPVK